MELKWMEGGEAVDALNPVIEEQGWTPLNDRTCRALVATEEDKVVGFLVLQLFPVLGPEWVSPEARGTSAIFKLQVEMRNFLQASEARGVLVIAESQIAQHLCEREGMERVEYPVYIAHSFTREKT